MAYNINWKESIWKRWTQKAPFSQIASYILKLCSPISHVLCWRSVYHKFQSYFGFLCQVIAQKPPILGHKLGFKGPNYENEALL